VRRIDSDLLLQLGSELRALRDANRAGMPLFAIFHPWFDLLNTLTTLTESLGLRMSRDAIARLDRVGRRVLVDFYTADVDPERYRAPLEERDASILTTVISELEIVLRAEIRQSDMYFASQVGIYSTADLIDRADEFFGSDLRAVIPERARADIRQAGRCLAFELPDGAAFHILKAMEEVMRQFAERVSGKPLSLKSRNWGEYIRCLREAGADPKLVEYLDYIRKNHRNPVLHPEQSLTQDEAVALFNAASNAIVPMARAMATSAGDAPEENGATY
jgi:hypothetical protein